MASLVTNGVFPTFSLQAISETKGSSSKLEISYKPLKSKSLNSRLLKVRADAKTFQSNLSSDDDVPVLKILRRMHKRNQGVDRKFHYFTIPKGISEETIRLISSRKEEPDWMLEFRLNSYHKFCQLIKAKYPEDFQNMSYNPEPKKAPTLNIIDEEQPEIINNDKLGVSLNEKKLVPDRASALIASHRETIKESGVIFCSISEAIKEHPKLVKEYLGKAVSTDDNFYSALNSALFSDGTFVYIPKDTKCPIQIATLFHMNAMEMGQFERTLIIADDRSSVEFLDSHTPPSYDTDQLHVEVVELYCNEEAEIIYHTCKYWYPGDEYRLGGIHKLVTRRGFRTGRKSKIYWKSLEGVRNYSTSLVLGGDFVGES